MKTLRFLGMALMAVLMCVNLASCGGNDDPTEEKKEEIVSKTKKLTEIKQTYSFGKKYYALFSYDEKNRLTNIKTGNYEREWSTDCTWGSDIVIYNSDSYYIKNGLIFDDDDYKHNYNSSNQLISNIENNGNRKRINTWSNGNLVKSEFYWGEELDEVLQFSYGDKTCKGHFPLMAPAIFYHIDCSTLYYEDFGLEMTHPDLFGIKTKLLPNKIIETGSSNETVYSIEYTFTNDGYIESCTVVEENSSDNDTMITTFKWQ